MRIAIYYTHSETMGHSCRIKKISEFLARKGHEVLVLQGGIPQPFLEFGGVSIVNIPQPLYGRDRLYTESKKVLDKSVVNKRKDIIKGNITRFRPDAVFTEYFPFGRTEAKYELYPVLEFIKKRLAGTKIYASIGYPIFGNIISRKIIDFSGIYDRIFIHTPGIEKEYAERFFSDPVRYKSVFDSLKDKITFTGYIADDMPGKAENISGMGKRKLVVVSRGGGIVYPKIVSTPMLLAKDFEDIFFLVVSGPATTDEEWKVFSRMAERCGNVELRKYVPGLQRFIHSSSISMNMSGYNTSVELLLGRKKSIVVPLIFEVEQSYRASMLHDVLGASILPYKSLSPDSLSEKIDYQLNMKTETGVKDEWFGGLRNLERSLGA